ncbi:MAG: hypothetical protein KF760_14680 [Candidatus Eremiobacteraeota bacterium]|nr:hypothetical protein [Candidatus Eremiobacteraeota bacterium]MCW5869955.1 hypothetical protein [Candidatus Eremiobacteraeota bacterium]
MKSLLMGAALAVSLAGAAWSENWPFEPGAGVGPVKLGLDYLEPTRFLTPDRQIPGSLGGVYLIYKEGIETQCQGKRIIEVVVKKTSFTGGGRTVEVSLPGGLKIGSPATQLQGAFGTGMVSSNLPTAKGFPQKTVYAWPYKGVEAQAEGGKIIQFSIFPKK